MPAASSYTVAGRVPGDYLLGVTAAGVVKRFADYPASNLLLNSGMEVSQLNGANAITGLTGVSSYTVDQWVLTATGAAIFTAQQVADAPAGFEYSLKVTVTTADASLAATDDYIIYQPIEGYRTARLAFGAAGAQSVSVGFWCKVHRTGTYSGSIKNGALNRSYPFNFTVNVADTWEYKTVTIPGDTTGTWSTTTGVGIYLAICLGSGSNFLGTANTWAASNLSGVTGTTNGVAATSDIFQITGAFLVPGDAPVPQEMSQYILRPFDEDFQLCQRYLNVISFSNATSLGAMSVYSTTGAWGPVVHFGTTMRIVPTISIRSTSDFVIFYGGGPASVGFSSITWGSEVTKVFVSASTVSSAVLTAGQAVILSTTGSNGQIYADGRM